MKTIPFYDLPVISGLPANWKEDLQELGTSGRRIVVDQGKAPAAGDEVIVMYDGKPKLEHYNGQPNVYGVVVADV